MNLDAVARIDNTKTVQMYLDIMPEDTVAKFYVLPSVVLKDEAGKDYDPTRDVAVVKGKSVTILKLFHEFGDPDLLLPGQLICVDRDVKGYTVKKSIGERIKAFEYKGVSYTYGQSILVTATVGTGKTTTITALCREFCLEKGTTSWRCLFGERMEDRMYALDEEDLTIDTNSSSPIGLQYSRLMEALALALDSAHSGNHALFAIDSLTRIVQSLTGLYSKSHMVSGGIAFEVTEMVANLIRLGGCYGKGTLTVIGTCLFANGNNSWKQIYDVLSAAADGEVKILRLTSGLAFDVKTRRPPEVHHPYITIPYINKKLYY